MLDKLYKIAKLCDEVLESDKKSMDIIIYLNESKHENLQQELYKSQNNNLQGYVSFSVFNVVFYGIKFIIKID